MGPVNVVFYGRGGQGIKTAGRILGRALFESGYHVQDFPIYGAERRGAPVYSYVAAAPEEVLQRGAPSSADITVVVDKSLLGNLSPSGIGIVNWGAEIPGMLSVDMTSEVAGLSPGAISAVAAGAAAAVIINLPVDKLLIGIEKEVKANKEALEAEERAAIKTYWKIRKSPLPPPIIAPKKEDHLILLQPEEPSLSTPVITAKGTSVLRKTGQWRLVRPLVDREACKACFLCYLTCPEGSIQLDDQEKPLIDYDNCKGCMICQNVCPFKAIRGVPESEVLDQID